jgi:hypothetical protein
LIKKLDVLDLVRDDSAQNPVSKGLQDIPLYQRLESIRADCSYESKSYSGFQTICMIALRIPFLIPLYPFLFLLNLLGIGDVIYRLVATVLERGNCRQGACALPE